MIFQQEKTPFQAVKSRSSNSREIDIFTKALTHGFGPKMAIFPTFSFLSIQASKMSFMIFQSEKTSFQATKTRSSNSRKLKFFGFGAIMAIFQTFSCLSIQARKMSFMIFQSKKYAILGYKKKKIEWQKIDIFQKGLTNGCCKKNGRFSNLFFQEIQARKMSFLIF